MEQYTLPSGVDIASPEQIGSRVTQAKESAWDWVAYNIILLVVNAFGVACLVYVGSALGGNGVGPLALGFSFGFALLVLYGIFWTTVRVHFSPTIAALKCVLWSFGFEERTYLLPIKTQYNVLFDLIYTALAISAQVGGGLLGALLLKHTSSGVLKASAPVTLITNEHALAVEWALGVFYTIAVFVATYDGLPWQVHAIATPIVVRIAYFIGVAASLNVGAGGSLNIARWFSVAAVTGVWDGAWVFTVGPILATITVGVMIVPMFWALGLKGRRAAHTKGD